MAEVTGTDYEYLKIQNGENIIKHNLRDRVARDRTDYSLYQTIDHTQNYMSNKYIDIKYDIGTDLFSKFLNPNTFKNFGYVILPCKAGDSFYITATGADSMPIWAFTNTSYVLQSLSAQTKVDDVMVTASKDGYFVCNHNLLKDYSLFAKQLVQAASNDVVTAIDQTMRQTVDYSADFIANSQIDLYKSKGAEVDIANPISTENWNCIVLPCNAGDHFALTGSADSATVLLWAFLDTNRKLLLRAAEHAVLNNNSLKADADGYLVCNVENAKPYSLNVTKLIAPVSEEKIVEMMKTAGKLESTGDNSDRTAEIIARLNAYGYCELGNGEFVVANLEMPAGTELCGQGYATVLKLDTTLTSGSAVIIKSRCTVRDLTLVGSDTDISFTSDGERPTQKRHGISIAAKPVEDAHISNVRIYRFAGYGIEAFYKYTVADTTLKSIVFNADNCSIDGCFAGFAVGYNVKNCCFNHCCCSSGRKGADLYGECFVSDCIFTDNVINVNITSGGARLMNCVFHDKNSPSEYALRLYSISKTTSISGCEFYNCGSIQSNSPTANGIFIGCSFNTMTLPIQCDGTSASGFGLLFINCMFTAKVTDSGNIEEATEGIVRLKNCYRVSSGNLVDLMER